MQRQDRLGVRTATELERKYNIKKIHNTAEKASSDMRQLPESLGLQVKNGETTATVTLKVGDREVSQLIDMRGLVSLLGLRTEGEIPVNGGNVFGKLQSEDKERLVLDLAAGVAALTGVFRTAGENTTGVFEPGRLMLEKTDAQGTVLLRLQLREDSVELTAEDASLKLQLREGKGRLSGLSEPEEDKDAANKAYVDRELQKLRQELGLNEGE